MGQLVMQMPLCCMVRTAIKLWATPHWSDHESDLSFQVLCIIHLLYWRWSHNASLYHTHTHNVSLIFLQKNCFDLAPRGSSLLLQFSSIREFKHRETLQRRIGLAAAVMFKVKTYGVTRWIPGRSARMYGLIDRRSTSLWAPSSSLSLWKFMQTIAWPLSSFKLCSFIFLPIC